MAKAAKGRARRAPAGGAAPRKTSYCSFCFKSQHQAKMLISGPAGIFICSECVYVCNECVAGRFPDKSKFPTDRALAGAASTDRGDPAGQGQSAAMGGRPAALTRGQLGANWSRVGDVTPI